MARSSQVSSSTTSITDPAEIEAYAPPRTDDLNGQCAPEIVRAAECVAGLLPTDLLLAEEDLRRHLRWIADACAGGMVARDNGSALPIRRRLIDLIREEVLRGWRIRPAEAGRMLDVLQELERAQSACVPDQDQSLAAELADRGGLDLVVEVAHDMRSPLTSILFLSEILHRGQSGSFNDVQKRQIGIVYSAALGLVGMASDLIEMAKGGSQLAANAPTPFSINEVLSSVHDLVRPMAEEKRLGLVIQNCRSPLRNGHSIPINRVLLNLATNAVKFTQEGSVELAADPVEGSRVRFSVTDTGPGIPASAMEFLYQPFRRVTTRQSGYTFSGTGLGLAICKRLVGALGSSLHVETSPGAGTCFWFELDLPPVSSLEHQ